MDKTPCLTIHQPYASLVAGGFKLVENRVWRTAYAGPVWIHASKRFVALDDMPLPGVTELVQQLPVQLIIARGELVACVEYAFARETLMYGHLLEDPHASGPYCWILQDVKPLAQPVPCRGYQRLWQPDQELRAQLAHA